MVHGLRLRDGKAHWYRNRWVRSADVARAGRKRQDGPHTGGFDFADNTNIIGHAGRTLEPPNSVPQKSDGPMVSSSSVSS